jgi:hypothetical protein
MSDARNLAVIRIDDDFDVEKMRFDFPALDLVSFRSGDEELHGINDFISFIDYWSGYDRKQVIDLIVSDVRFNDCTSPINRIGNEEAQETPNGLIYALPFAALARAAGRPLGFAIHSADAGLWRDLSVEGQPRAKRDMALIAAQFVGQIAAVLGEGRLAREEDCWSYISRKVGQDRRHIDGVRVALRDFRYKLAAVKVLPDSWRELHQWCLDNGQRVARGEAVYLTADNDIGLAYLAEDGTRHHINLLSIFADAHQYDTAFDFAVNELPAVCFDLSAQCRHDDPFLDEGHLPLFGALAQSTRSVHDSYATALEVLNAFPATGGASTIVTQMKRQKGWSDIGVGLAMLLADIDFALGQNADWQELYNTAPWDGYNDAFDGDASRTLRGYVAGAQKALKAADCAAITRTGLTELLDANGLECDDDGLTRVIKCLESLGVLVRASPRAQTFAVHRDIAEDLVPQRPEKLPKNWQDLTQGELGRLSRAKYLLARFGFSYEGPKADEGEIKRLISGIFQETQDKVKGGAFLKEFRKGSSPAWVRELGRAYAAGLNCKEADWPVSIRR